MVAALADEARALLAGADPTAYLELGDLDVLPEDYRPVLARVRPDLAGVGSSGAAGEADRAPQ